MQRLTDEIRYFLEKNGFRCSVLLRDGFEVIVVTTLDGRHQKTVLPLRIQARSIEEAAENSEDAWRCIEFIRDIEGYPLVITEDRWRGMPEMTGSRLLSHLEVFTPVYARNCEVRRIEKDVAREFLTRNHSYGYAACRYCYGLFFKRFTGAGAEELAGSGPEAGQLIAVASFSNARKTASL